MEADTTAVTKQLYGYRENEVFSTSVGLLGKYECTHLKCCEIVCYMEYQHIQVHEKTILYEISCKPWEVVGADIFSIKNRILLCIVDYYNKFPIVKKPEALLTDDLIGTAKIVFGELDLQRK